jgi:hypothetical protein
MITHGEWNDERNVLIILHNTNRWKLLKRNE